MSSFVGQFVALYLLCVFWQGSSFLIGGKSLTTGFFKRPSTAIKSIANEVSVGSIDMLQKHLMERTVCFAVLPKAAFSEERMSSLRHRFASEHTWNSFLTKDQLHHLVVGKYFCPVLQYAQSNNWCIFMEKKLVDMQYQRLTKFIGTEYDLSPEPVDEFGVPVPQPDLLRHKFMFCKKFHMVVLDGVPKGKGAELEEEYARARNGGKAGSEDDSDGSTEGEIDGEGNGGGEEIAGEEGDSEGNNESQYGDLAGDNESDGSIVGDDSNV